MELHAEFMAASVVLAPDKFARDQFVHRAAQLLQAESQFIHPDSFTLVDPPFFVMRPRCPKSDLLQENRRFDRPHNARQFGVIADRSSGHLQDVRHGAVLYGFEGFSVLDKTERRSYISHVSRRESLPKEIYAPSWHLSTD